MLGMIAVGIGMVVGIALFVPFVAITYRRRGRLSVPRALLWAVALVYFWAIWTYTLLPLPEPDSIRCVGMVIDPLAVVRDVQKAIAAPGRTLTHPAILQLVFNVLLFAPLGFLLRVLGGRGILTALFVGLGLSLLVETTQLTGVWGIYPCAYRFFDVGDLMTNTAGAVLGSLVALVVPRERRGLAKVTDADLPRPVTRGRRALAMLCDGLGFLLTSWAVSVVVQLFLQYVLHARQAVLAGTIAEFVGTGGVALVWLVVTLVTGQSIGDLAVQLRYDGDRMPVLAARLLRWAGGISALSALALLGGVFDAMSSLLILVACATFLFTRRGRGLPGLLSRQHLVDARDRRRARGV